MGKRTLDGKWYMYVSSRHDSLGRRAFGRRLSQRPLPASVLTARKEAKTEVKTNFLIIYLLSEKDITGEMASVRRLGQRVGRPGELFLERVPRAIVSF